MSTTVTGQAELNIGSYRRGYDEFFARFPVDPSAEIGPMELGGRQGLRVRYRDDAPRRILFIHGGGYICGNPEGARSVAALLAGAADAEVLLPRYRLGPECPHPAAIEDVLTAYRSLLDQGADRSRLAVVGESAGGGLALSVVIELVRAGIPPAALVAWSPLADLDLSTAATKTNAGSDPMVTGTVLTMSVEAYLQSQDPRTPSASPVYADLTGLPPLLIQVGGREALLDDAKRVAANARSAGVEVTLEIAEGQPHVFQYQAARREEARAAVRRTADFVARHTG